MKEHLLKFSLVLLAGCAGPGDRLPEIQPGHVEMNGNTPCITYAVKPGDRLSFIEIANHSSAGDSFQKMCVKMRCIRSRASVCRRWVIISKAAINMWRITAWIIRVMNENALLK
ncbi:putative T6SS immunity periplasmic lipoprotein [Cronobacter malonaticus]